MPTVGDAEAARKPSSKYLMMAEKTSHELDYIWEPLPNDVPSSRAPPHREPWKWGKNEGEPAKIPMPCARREPKRDKQRPKQQRQESLCFVPRFLRRGKRGCC